MCTAFSAQQREKRLKKIHALKDSYYTANSNIESVGSDSSRGESVHDGVEEEYTQETSISDQVTHSD